MTIAESFYEEIMDHLSTITLLNEKAFLQGHRRSKAIGEYTVDIKTQVNRGIYTFNRETKENENEYFKENQEILGPENKEEVEMKTTICEHKADYNNNHNDDLTGHSFPTINYDVISNKASTSQIRRCEKKGTKESGPASTTLFFIQETLEKRGKSVKINTKHVYRSKSARYIHENSTDTISVQKRISDSFGKKCKMTRRPLEQGKEKYDSLSNTQTKRSDYKDSVYKKQYLLHEAARLGDLNEVHRLIFNDRYSVWQVNDKNLLPIDLAGNFETLKFLLDATKFYMKENKQDKNLSNSCRLLTEL